MRLHPRVIGGAGGPDEIQNFDFRKYHCASPDWDTCWSSCWFGHRSHDRSVSINHFEYSVASPLIFCSHPRHLRREASASDEF